MRKEPRQIVDLMERNIEIALDPDRFISYHDCFSFVRNLEEVESEIAKLVKSESARAASLYEAFLSGCKEKANEIDDSGGSFGMFVDSLVCGWIKSRQAAGADPDETAIRLLFWMDHDPFCLLHQIERETARVFNKAGLAAFERQVRARFDKGCAATSSDPAQRPPTAAQRHWGAVLRAIYLRQRNVKAYVTLAELTGLTTSDCLAIAGIHLTRRKFEEALAWVGRGLEIDKNMPYGSTAGHDLARLKRELLARAGRSSEALDGAWIEYQKCPCKLSYDELMKFVPRTDRPSWHKKALDAATDSNLSTFIELHLSTGEVARLVDRLRRTSDGTLEAESHYVTERAAKKLARTQPEISARLWRAQGMRILKQKKSKYYREALSDLENAKRCYERAGLNSAWHCFVRDIRSEHYRKKGFMAEFEVLVAGKKPGSQPSFLERAKARWSPDK
jgi:hypothetical protein